MTQNTPDYFPACWSDDERMGALFSVVRSSSTNPADYPAKVKFWTELILLTCSRTHMFIWDYTALCETFKRKNAAPQCLTAVIQEMLRSGAVQRLDDFKREQRDSQGWLSWSFQALVKKPAVFARDLVWPVGENSKSLQMDRFVAVGLVKSTAEEVFNRHQLSVTNDTTDHLVPISVLSDQVKDLCPTEEVFDLILTQLKRNKQIVELQLSEKEKIAKFAKPEQTETLDITETDVGIFRLQKTMEDLESRVKKLSEDSEKCMADARLCIQKGLKNSALSALRRRKAVERLLEKNEAALNNVHSLLLRLHEANSDAMVYDAYKVGVAAIKKTFADGGLTPDSVNTTMDEMAEVLESHGDIQQSLAQGFADVSASDADLDRELDELLSEGHQYDPTLTCTDDVTAAMMGLGIDDKGDLPEAPSDRPTRVIAKPAQQRQRETAT
ncbi:PREDICTED: charged multivesicular body protein 7-like [Priapulus caudatus]|uniref:Charged multivesicular body protein 7 n=1 Tax=Priapulus caudatus TaxID=37621 RepID=A0ABM1EB37_PRICU|nr:PREDICTED: charged multivesicular body protein 7-like [Priapulus caudatus]